MLTTLARTLDLLALAFAFGSTVWFFLVQSPVLVKRMGRDRFVPLQMSLALVLFRSLSVALVIMVAASIGYSSDPFSTHVLTAALGLAGAAINSFLVLPRALKTGGTSLKEEQTAEEQKSVGSFVSQGAGEASRFWHRAVVFFVVVMLAGLVPHAVILVSGQVVAPQIAATAPEEHAGAHTGAGLALDSGKRWKANRETTEGVHTMLALVRQAAARGEGAAVARQLDGEYQAIFKRCTMTGAAHDQLHRFLIPVGELLRHLAGGDRATLHQLEEHLRQYDTYFE